jgi:predicted CopG family antitoxin
MQNLKEYIAESTVEPVPAVKRFYRVNILKQNSYGDQIGDIEELSYKYYSGLEPKRFAFGRPSGNSWEWALDVKVKDNDSKKSFENFIKRYGNEKENEFYKLTLSKTEAEKIANKAKRDYKNQKWTLESLFAAIKKDKNLMSLGFNYKITQTYTQVDNHKVDSIYVSCMWRIMVKDNRIFVQRSGWRTYEVPNLPSLYKVLSADTGSDSDESKRCRYSITN